MNTITTRAFLALLVGFLAACASGGGQGGSLIWEDGNGSDRTTEPDREPEPAPEPDGEGVVTIPDEVMKQLMGFVNQPQVVIADRIEVEANSLRNCRRRPATSAMAPSTGVERATIAMERAIESPQ